VAGRLQGCSHPRGTHGADDLPRALHLLDERVERRWRGIAAGSGRHQARGVVGGREDDQQRGGIEQMLQQVGGALGDGFPARRAAQAAREPGQLVQDRQGVGQRGLPFRTRAGVAEDPPRAGTPSVVNS
jgi:hypothetical protein